MCLTRPARFRQAFGLSKATNGRKIWRTLSVDISMDESPFNMKLLKWCVTQNECYDTMVLNDRIVHHVSNDINNQQ